MSIQSVLFNVEILKVKNKSRTHKKIDLCTSTFNNLILKISQSSKKKALISYSKITLTKCKIYN